MSEVMDLAMERVPISVLQEHPENARRGDVATIAASLQRLGQYRPVIVNRGSLTGRPMEILAGHHITKAAASLGWLSVAVSYVDVDEDDGRAILAVDNRAPELGDYDTAALYRLLNAMPDLTGTGYAQDDLDDMHVLLEQSARQVILDPAPADDPPPKFDFDPDKWARSDRRIMVLDLPVPVFIWLQDRFIELCESRDLDNNVDVVLALVSEATGLPVPIPEDIHGPDEE